jgi:hypothetical protein
VVISITEQSLMTPDIVAFMKEIAGSGNVFGVDVICRNESLPRRTIKLMKTVCDDNNIQRPSISYPMLNPII